MATAWRVLITDHPWPDLDIERAILEEIGAEVIEPDPPNAEGIAAAALTADAVAACWAPFPGEVLEKCPRCKVVSRLGVGLDNIPVATATRLGIPVTYVPDYCVTEVADHTLALILSLLRGTTLFDRSLKADRYDPSLFPPRRLSELTLGIVGWGRIGQAVAERAAAFGFHLLATSRSGNSRGHSVRMTSLDELVAESDVISLHMPLSDESRHLFDAARIARMKPAAYLVNTSRGGLIDPEALLAALQEDRLAGAGLDVFSPEPPPPGDPLIAHPRVIATPHVAFRSTEALIELRVRTARQIADVLLGRIPEHVVNPEVLPAR